MKRFFSVHDLYLKDYGFDYEVFEVAPENYKFTAEDLAYLNALEPERYEATVPMTPYERNLLRKWAISDHSVHDSPDSRYICITEHSPASDFLDAYCMSRDIQIATKGMAPKKRETYLKNYTVWRNDPPDDRDPFLLYKQKRPLFF